ncbi:response regulator transcription factor [Candidatus Dojkabacteria bacterium]|nr:response regulator transcription factor [Candidatus Dojkabacteria bacterium]
MRLLIVEDEHDIAIPLKKMLENIGYAVDFVDNGKDGLQSVLTNDYDCILLDLNLPEIDGINLAQKMRNQKNNTPIIMVTARSQMYDKLEGFESGADDYVTKPFNISELIARIKAVIKRNSPNRDNILKFGKYEVFLNQNKIQDTTSKKEIELSNKEIGILEYLIRHKNSIVSSEDLLEHVWDQEVDIFTETVKTHIKTLRKKIDPEKKIIKTIRGKGYILEQ